MRSFFTRGRERAVPAGSHLLLALALCACGGGGDADTASARSADEAAPATQTAAADPSSPCPTPPVVDTTLFREPWAVVSGRLREMGARFPDTRENSDTARVPLCKDCEAVELVIRADTTTYCTTPAQLDSGQTRLMGIFILASPFPGNPAAGWGRIPANDSIFVFASSSDGPATLVYRDGERSVTAPAGSWMFFYCDDPHVGSRPEAQWRSRLESVRNENAGEKSKAFEDGGGNYGWMACASGCCQFYTPPPNPIIFDPVTGRPATPAAAAASARPTWCPKT